MLWNASALQGYSIKATDGLIGTVSDLLVQDTDWAIRWLVIDTGDWLFGRQLLIPISALGEPDPEVHYLPVRLTMRQVEGSPDFDTNLPLSQTTDRAAYDHYNLPRCHENFLWRGYHQKPEDLAEADVTLMSGNTESGTVNSAVRERPVRSTSEIRGNSVDATDGDIGHAEDFLIDTSAWQLRYLIVHTSSWWDGEKLLVSFPLVKSIDSAKGVIHLSVSQHQVKNSPPYVEEETANGAFEDLFHSYFGIRGPRR